jgi:hypothetical protein
MNAKLHLYDVADLLAEIVARGHKYSHGCGLVCFGCYRGRFNQRKVSEINCTGRIAAQSEATRENNDVSNEFGYRQLQAQAKESPWVRGGMTFGFYMVVGLFVILMAEFVWGVVELVTLFV